MHSLPSRRRLSQSNFFRFKCHRLSPLPLPLPHPPPPVPAAPAPPLPGLLPPAAAPRLSINTPPTVSADTHTLTHAVTSAADRQQARRPPSAQTQLHTHLYTHLHTPGPERQALARRHGNAVRRQGSRTFSQSANRVAVIPPEPPRASSLQSSHF